MSVMWYLRPEETVHPIAKMFYENEVFKTHTYHEHNVEDFIERCCVYVFNVSMIAQDLLPAYRMYNTRYIRGRPKFPIWHSEMPTYVCQDRYKDKNTSKIKNWFVRMICAGLQLSSFLLEQDFLHTRRYQSGRRQC